MSDGGGWLVIPNWTRFQHYSDRDPIWIKDYVSQLHDDDWLGLTLAERGALQTLRLLYATSDGKLPFRVAVRALGVRGRRASDTLVSLNRAGFIEVVASKPLALARSREKRRVEENDSASTERQDPSDNGSLEPASTTVNEQMLRLAHGWLDAHGAGREPNRDEAWEPTPEEPF